MQKFRFRLVVRFCAPTSAEAASSSYIRTNKRNRQNYLHSGDGYDACPGVKI